MLMGYEALRDLPLEDQEVETPIETCSTPMLVKTCRCPDSRAGLGMANGILALVPSAKVGHIGLYRDDRQPMSRTNTTASCQPRSNCVPSLLPTRCWQPAVPAEAIDFIKARGGKNIKFMAIIAAPEGLKRLHEAHPDVQIYVGHVDRCLNEKRFTSAQKYLEMQGIGFWYEINQSSIENEESGLRFGPLSFFRERHIMA